MDFVHFAISARLAHGDLVAADAALEASPPDDGVRLILVKQLLVSCANVADLEQICRALYKDHPAISEIITPHRPNFEFAKYHPEHRGWSRQPGAQPKDPRMAA
ncbi:hypothetical protein JNW90_32720 [Micromonospora sp. STR1s_5]|nr:hypothetical protein [Micromonospora sp. STR1s_5]